MMNKIKISKVSDRVFSLKGFGKGSFNDCGSCSCGKDKKGDSCCRFGVYVDKDSYDLIIKHKALIEKALKTPVEKCFDRGWTSDTDFLGGNSIGTRVRKENNFCMFHSLRGKGCELVKTVIKNKLPARTIPSACRIYPLTWNNDKLYVGRPTRHSCYCVRKENNTKDSIFETNKKEIEDIFDIDSRCLK